jgi:hypothetical protein
MANEPYISGYIVKASNNAESLGQTLVVMTPTGLKTAVTDRRGQVTEIR